MVLIVTTQRLDDSIRPILQIRTENNAVREIGKISHLSGHIYQEEPSPLPGARAVVVPSSLGLASEYTVRTAQRRVQLDTGDDAPPPVRGVTVGKYLNSDKENLFFFVYALELPDDFVFPDRSEMGDFSLPDLLAIRASQTLRMAEQLCQLTDLPSRRWQSAAEIVSLNLRLHDYDELADGLADLQTRSADEIERMLSKLRRLIAETAVKSTSEDDEVEIMGLSGWQYREFFGVLMRLYAELGVAGAAEQLQPSELIDATRERLERLYQDGNLIRSLPIEL